MAPISPGRTSGPRQKVKKPTASTNLHRFEPFTKRISRLKIDPIHHVEQAKPIDEDVGLKHSHFRETFDHWTDLNLSQNYTDFARKVSPLSESLPQLLHHADTVFGLLVEYIEKKDALALESLLSLVAHFAQDLRHKFEKYFSRTVTLVAQVAAFHDAPDVIEWCFTCLAWIFKFLQRLLVPDLRPLLTIMLPYLGGRKGYVARFAAESLAFLLRKAAVLYPRDEAPLSRAVTFLLRNLHDVANDPLTDNFKLGLMTLFSEAALGPDAALHGSGAHLVSCIISTMLKECLLGLPEFDVFEGFLINLAHQTDSLGFLPLTQLVKQYIRSLNPSSSSAEIKLYQRLLFLVIATRKGSRIHDWNNTIENVLRLGELTNAEDNTSTDALEQSQERLTIVAMLMQYAPMHELLPFTTKILHDTIARIKPRQFYQFCDFFASLGIDRFRSLLLPSFQKYIMSHWQDDEHGLCLSLHNLSQRHAIGPHAGPSNQIAVPTDWESHIIEVVSQTARSKERAFPVFTDAYLQLVDGFRFPQNDLNTQRLRNVLWQTVLDELQQSPMSFSSTSHRFVIGRVFSTYMHLTPLEDLEHNLWQYIHRLPPDHFRLLPFLKALDMYAHRSTPSSPLVEYDSQATQDNLLENLLSNSVTLKTFSLKLLKYFSSTQAAAITEAFDLALEILQTPYTPDHVREISMLLRRLPQHQKNFSGALRKLIPQFCMGLLPSYHEQTRECLCAVLADLAREGEDETIILEIGMKWLQSPSTAFRESAGKLAEESLTKTTPFQCSNVIAISREARYFSTEYEDAESKLLQSFERDHSICTVEPPSTGRSIALQLFRSIPDIVEKRSRLLIPVFFSAQNHQRSDVTAADAAESISSRTLSPGISEADWTLRDRKCFIELLGQFKNSRVLYRSQEVHATLLELLTNGNVEIQRLALRAISGWKEPSLQAHYEALVRLLDDKTFSTELGLLLTPDFDQSPIELTNRTYVIDIILRLLYGQMIGRSGSHGSQEGKRRTILRMILRLPQHEISQFLKLTLRGLADVAIVECSTIQTRLLETDLVPLDQQYGLLRMIHSMTDVLQTQLAPIGQIIVQPVLYCTARACHQLKNSALVDKLGRMTQVPVMIRNIRKIGLQCLDQLFKYCEDMDWSPYLELIFSEMITPRLSAFAAETAQGISWLLRIFSTWSHSAKMVRYLCYHDADVFDNLVDCLTTEAMKDEVKVFVLDEVIASVSAIAKDDLDPSNAAARILQSHAQKLFEGIARLLERRPSKQVLQSALVALPTLTSFSTSTSETQVLLESLMKALNDSNLHVSPKIRGNLLKAVEGLLERHGPELEHGSRSLIWVNTSILFNYFKDSPNRIVLCNILGHLSKGQPGLTQAAEICHDLNIASENLLKPDFDIQIRAIQSINEIDTSTSTQMQWLPLLNNLLYFSRTSDDFSIRSNAVSGLRNFIVESCRTKRRELETLINTILLPAFKKGVGEDSEAIRADYVSLFGLVVLHLPEENELEDLQELLVHDDDEASFFSNILHIQQHRRLRALRRLTSEVERGSIRASNVATFFLPLLEKFVANVDEDSNAQSLKGQSISTIGCLLLWLEWKQFKTAFRRYKRDMDSKSRSEREAVKLIGVSADALIKAIGQLDEKWYLEGQRKSHLATSLPSSTTISSELKTHFIPQLTTFVHLKDKSQISVRLPAAVTVVKLIKALPEENIAELIPPLLMDTSQILRSRAQESRDAARNALAEMVLLLGPSCLHFVLKELRTSLNRGYQLHVVSYTVHSILLATTPHLAKGALDYCVSDLVAVVMDDVFGAVGQEKDNKDYISSMKEVKSSKSFDSMNLIAKSTSVQALPKLLRPLQALLEGTLTTKQSRQVDELLRRIGMGLSENEAANSRDLLTFSFELTQDFYRQRTGISERKATNEEKSRVRYLVQPTFASKSTGGISSPLLYKIARFALDIVRSTFQKHDSLMTPQNVHGFLPIIGDALIEAQEDVKTSALRLLSTVIKLPLTQLDENAELYISEAVKIVRASISTNSESSQAAFKLVAGILRERRSVDIRSIDLAYLLKRILPELEQPDRQGVMFNFVKAVMARKIALPEVYEMADKLGIMMVTNHSGEARAAARGIYVHFLLDYPQTKSRWTKQMKFLLKNLEYKHAEGRQSVMEALNILLGKVGAEMVQEIVSCFFIPVLLRMANDETKECQEMAETLLGQVFRKADAVRLKTLLEPLRAWVEQSENAALTKLGMQAFGVFFEASEGNAGSEVTQLRSSIEKTLAAHSRDESVNWEPLYQALKLLSKLVNTNSAALLTRKQAALWSIICSLQSHPHPRVQSAAAGLIGVWFHDLAKANKDTGFVQLPLVGQLGLDLSGEAMFDLMRTFLRLIKRKESSDEYLTQIVHNLIFIGRCMCVNDLSVQIQDKSRDNKLENDEDEDFQESSDSQVASEEHMKDIPAIHYLLHQCSSILRHEAPRFTTASLIPKKIVLQLLKSLVPHIPTKKFPPNIIHGLLLPLIHLTDTNITAPRSADPAFAQAYQDITTAAHGVMETIQTKVGDAVYVKAMTTVARSVRDRREGRRAKRRIERVSEPERAARKKRRMGERKSSRKKELAGAFRRGRRGM